MEERLVVAGFGGQGVMAIGQLLTYAGMVEDREVSWLPSYGPEMRGGTANCSVIISEAKIGSPVVTKATSAIVMNAPSLDKFENEVVVDGNLLINSSLIDRKTSRTDVKTYYVPANELAEEIGNARTANMVMLGAYLEASGVVTTDSILEHAFVSVFGEGRKKLLPINKEAMEKGAACVREQK